MTLRAGADCPRLPPSQLFRRAFLFVGVLGMAIANADAEATLINMPLSTILSLAPRCQGLIMLYTHPASRGPDGNGPIYSRIRLLTHPHRIA